MPATDRHRKEGVVYNLCVAALEVGILVASFQKKKNIGFGYKSVGGGKMMIFVVSGVCWWK